MDELEITEVTKELIKAGNKVSRYRVKYRANGYLLFQEMNIHNELPDDVLKGMLSRIARKHFEETEAI